jgi:hypothetical protein
MVEVKVVEGEKTVTVKIDGRRGKRDRESDEDEDEGPAAKKGRFGAVLEMAASVMVSRLYL